MNKNVAILTLYYNSKNYGGILQAYALQKKLSELCYNAKQISYVMETGYKNPTRFRLILRPLKKIYNKICFKKWNSLRIPYEQKIYDFAYKIPHTKVVTAKTIATLTEEYKIFICGSDQIWNPVGWQPTFFLDFLPKDCYKISYAASVARDYLTEDELQYAYNYIKNFSAVSVREERTAEIFKDFNPQIDIQVMPDPTLLLTIDDWDKETIAPFVEQPYVFGYFLGNDIAHREQAIKFAKNNGLKLVLIPYMRKDMFKWDLDHKEFMKEGIGIREFLTLIKYANIILTDSFHGTVFSIIFRKAFLVINRFSDNDVNSMNSRIETLLLQMKLMQRYVKKIPEKCDFELSEEEIISIESNLCRLRESGTQFLVNNLKKCEKFIDFS